MPVSAAALEGGFSEPVFDAQATFRAVMDGLARPGLLQAVSKTARPPAPLSPAAAAVALTLCDNDTPVWLDARLSANPAVAEWLGVQTGAPIVSDPARAAFAFIAEPLAMPPLSAFAQGTQEYPDGSTTLVIGIDAFEGGRRLALSGPGIAGEIDAFPHPLPGDIGEQLARNRAAFPRGVDLILVAGDRLMGLPRSTTVKGA